MTFQLSIVSPLVNLRIHHGCPLLNAYMRKLVQVILLELFSLGIYISLPVTHALPVALPTQLSHQQVSLWYAVQFCKSLAWDEWLAEISRLLHEW